MINVPALLVTVRIALPMFASTRKAAPHAVAWRNVAASLVWRGPQKDGVVSLFARGHRPVMAVINAGRACSPSDMCGERESSANVLLCLSLCCLSMVLC